MNEDIVDNNTKAQEIKAKKNGIRSDYKLLHRKGNCRVKDNL
jgi:hypothetical protein